MMQLRQVILNLFEILDLMLSGGEANLAKARDTTTGDIVAIKQLAASPGEPNYNERVSRFQRAGKTVIGHPNVVDPLLYGEENGEHYIVFPFVDGAQLDIHIQRQGGRLPIDQVLTIIRGIAAGLAAAHAKGVVHRDIKPGNIMVQCDGQARVIDFGILRLANEKTITENGGLLGTLQWMSPEQITNPSSVDHRTDLYSLGALFYFMLTGALPVQGNDAPSIGLSVCQYIPPTPRQLDPSIPVHIDQACTKLLVKDPDGRFQSADDFIRALDGADVTSAVTVCPSCGGHAEPSFTYCPQCGAHLAASKKETRCFACGGACGDGTACSACKRLFSPSNHQISFSNGSLASVEFRVPEGIYVVGRDALAPRDGHISRHHFHVACLNGTVQIQDAGSTNKTYVGGRLAEQPTLIGTGDELRIAGNTAIYTRN